MSNKAGFKIRNSKNLYSNGGVWPTFSEHGKVWNTITALRSHLANAALHANKKRGLNSTVLHPYMEVGIEIVEVVEKPSDLLMEKEFNYRVFANELKG